MFKNIISKPPSLRLLEKVTTTIRWNCAISSVNCISSSSKSKLFWDLKSHHSYIFISVALYWIKGGLTVWSYGQEWRVEGMLIITVMFCYVTSDSEHIYGNSWWCNFYWKLWWVQILELKNWTNVVVLKFWVNLCVHHFVMTVLNFSILLVFIINLVMVTTDHFRHWARFDHEYFL